MTYDNAVALAEREKYERCWRDPAYRAACHGLHLYRTRRDLFPDDLTGKTVLDIGCGTGRLVAALREEGFHAFGIDLATNAVDPEIAKRWAGCFLSGYPLWETGEWQHVGFVARRWDFAVCSDVMEHIPPELVDQSLARIAAACDEVLFKIAHEPDVCGGGTLHLTLQPWPWWVGRMRAIGGAVEYLGVQVRSGMEDSLIRWRPREVREELFRGKNVAVFGSGDEPHWEKRDPDVIAGANCGAALAVDRFGRCDVLATTSYLFRKGRSAEEDETVESLRGLRLKSAWIDVKCGLPEGGEAGFLLRHFNNMIPVTTWVSPELREQVVREAAPIFVDVTRYQDAQRRELSATPLWVSTGVWLACLAVASGASSVTTVGITGKSRDHAHADRAVLARLTELWGVEVVR